MKKTIGFLVAAIGLIFSSSSAIAGSATWVNNPGSGDWNTAGNWTPGGPPNDPGDTATFQASAVNNISLSHPTQLNGIVFSFGATTSYTINTRALTLFGGGIANNSGAIQNLVVGIGGGIDFGNNASAGFNTTFTMGGDAGDGGALEFYGSSTAGNATIIVNGCNHDHGWGGISSFRDHSSAGNATIIVNGSAFQHCAACFDDPYPQGALFLYSTAGNATLIANGGTDGGDGGYIGFQMESTGGAARVKVFGNGNLDISNHNSISHGVTIGSLEGDGIVYLGGGTLTIGSNNLSTNFSGMLRDGSRFGGAGSSGSISKIGTGTLTLSGANTYSGATTIDGGKLAVESSIATTVTVNNGGTLGGSGTVAIVKVNNGGTVAPGGVQPLYVNGGDYYGGYVQHAGGVLKITLADANPSASGQLDIRSGATLDGTLEVRFVNGFLPASGQVFKLFHVGGVLSGSFAQIIFPDLRAGFQFQAEFVNGYYQITALNDGLPATGFLNISTRMPVGTGDNALIGGFIVTGTETKRVILRAPGPSLGGFGVPGVLADPTLELHDGSGAIIATNDNWKETQQAEIEATGLAPANDLESAIVRTFDPGAYTAVVRGKNNSTGVGLVEAYDLAPAAKSQLGNISTRGFVETGDNVMIGGFIAGNQAMHVMVRAIGPSLTQLGIANALADPTLELHNSNGATIAFNNDWQETDAASIAATGIPPANDKESAILTTLAPSNYTAIVRGQNDTTGVGLVEVYNLQ